MTVKCQSFFSGCQHAALFSLARFLPTLLSAVVLDLRPAFKERFSVCKRGVPTHRAETAIHAIMCAWGLLWLQGPLLILLPGCSAALTCQRHSKADHEMSMLTAQLASTENIIRCLVVVVDLLSFCHQDDGF